MPARGDFGPASERECQTPRQAAQVPGASPVEKCRSRVPEGQIWRSRHVRDQLFPGSTNARTSNHSDVVCEVKPQGETKLHPLGYDHDGSCIVGWGTSASARIHQNMACHPQQHITRKYALLQRGI
eukprot:scaffold5207_cov129-Isochrysis_galbana.AAC.3